jgi:hypothetical protein
MRPKSLVIALISALGVAGTAGAGLAIALDSPRSPASGTRSPGRAPAPAERIPNLTSVKQDIVDYHDSRAWDRDIDKADATAQRYLADRLRKGVRRPAIVLDIDDTSLETYSYRVSHDFGYDADEWNKFAFGRKFRAIPGTRELARYADSRDVSVFFVTGRRESKRMRTSTLANLAEQGYPKPARLYLRPDGDTNQSVVPYKSGVRARLERNGYDIVVNIGDQWSDLAGGHADRAVKLPNPMYSLP